MLKTSFHLSLHSTWLSISLCNDSQSLTDLKVWKHWVFALSANKARDAWVRQSISLTNMTKKQAQAGIPVGLLRWQITSLSVCHLLPHIASCLSDNWWTTAVRDLSFQNDLIFWLIRCECNTESNAFEKSKKAISVCLPWTVDLAMQWTVSIAE